LFPSGEYTPNFLASAGGIYYNHKKFAESKVYFQTLVRRFPGAEQKSLAMRSIMDSYFALGKFKDSEMIAKRIMSETAIPDDQKEFARARLGQAIFKNANTWRNRVITLLLQPNIFEFIQKLRKRSKWLNGHC
jgi:hypothetical protein